ncbi:MAG: DNA replication/repair protein RecF [Chlamydiae bacterium]|nr:DNA replication/repair protein RecF [Chlamydiota bacterium]
MLAQTMFVQSLYLQNFRNFEQTSISFSPGINVIHGLNAQGKTNILEAIYLICMGRSFRTTHLQELIKQGKEFFYIEAHFVKDGIEQVLKLSFNGQTRKIQYNSTTYASFVPLLGLLPIVLCTPTDISLISGSPSERRQFIDLHLAQIDPLYVHHLTRYLKAMKQRNYLLRHKKSSSFSVWEASMAHSAEYLMKKRKEASLHFSPFLEQNMQCLSQSQEKLEIGYKASFAKNSSDICKDLVVLLEKNRSKDIAVGTTLVGPHKDDYLLSVNEREAKLYCSEGQKRCAITALRFGEWKRLSEILEVPPIMGIDDFAIHLDPKRTSFLQENLKNLGQVFITTPNHIEIHQDQNSIYVQEGTVFQ